MAAYPPILALADHVGRFPLSGISRRSPTGTKGRFLSARACATSQGGVLEDDGDGTGESAPTGAAAGCNFGLQREAYGTGVKKKRKKLRKTEQNTRSFREFASFSAKNRRFSRPTTARLHARRPVPAV